MRPNLPRYVQVVRAKGTDYVYFRRQGQRSKVPHFTSVHALGRPTQFIARCGVGLGVVVIDGGRLPDDPTSLEFQKTYLELLGKTELDPEPLCIVDSSIAALIRDYRSSEEFLSLKKKTQRDYGRMLDTFAPIGHHPADSVRRGHIRELSKTFAGKRRTQQLFGQVASVLFNFEANAG